MTLAKDIIEKLQELFPENLRSEWDITQGLISGSVDKKVKTVVLSLEFRDNVAKKNADMIIVHHPPKFGPEKSITNPFYNNIDIGDKVVYAIHSSLDRTGFANKAIAEKLFSKVGYDIVKVLDDGTAIIELKSPMAEDVATSMIKNILGLKSVNSIVKKDKIKRIAIHGGEGFNQEHVITASKEGIDLYLAGDMMHHLAEHAHFFEINFIDIGHFSEQEGMEKLTKVLEKDFKDIHFEYVEQRPLWSIK